jgi:hypothetical protein
MLEQRVEPFAVLVSRVLRCRTRESILEQLATSRNACSMSPYFSRAESIFDHREK